MVYKKVLFLHRNKQLTHGVTGNTFDFGSKESRFEPWWVNALKEEKKEKKAAIEISIVAFFRYILSLLR